ncbi:MAG TPA: hypothetical protein VKE94_01235, partial [Gemmataceae bacterium]|nr:hypothetical protein [Gemmataceae bacterium]
FHHALDAFLRWPEAEVGFSGSRRVHPPERVAQEVELQPASMHRNFAPKKPKRRPMAGFWCEKS